MESTAEPPIHFTVDSIFSDLMRSPRAVSALKPVLDGVASRIQGLIGGTENAQSAIPNEMVQAMLNNMPLRGLVSFAAGSFTYEQLQAMIEQIND